MLRRVYRQNKKQERNRDFHRQQLITPLRSAQPEIIKAAVNADGKRIRLDCSHLQ
jgi:hypothetical protein